LYELFQLAPVGIYRFAGPNTLPAWEQRCHLSRVASENIVPDTQRTPYKDPTPTYVHLKIGADNTPPQRFDDILFTDVSGEMFEHARNSTDECKELTFLRRAEQFLVFLDSEKAIRPTSRWAMIGEAKSLLQALGQVYVERAFRFTQSDVQLGGKRDCMRQGSPEKTDGRLPPSKR
jgi:hypothetical protein